MKHISLKFVVFLWFGVLIAGLSVISTILMLNIRSDAVEVDMKAVLAFEVYGSSDRVKEHLDDPAAVTLSEREDVTVALYRADGSRVSGEIPAYLEVPHFEDRIFRTSGEYYIYDYYIDLDGGYWLRGYCSKKTVPLAANSPSGIAALLLPGVAILGTAAGFVIFLLSLKQIKKLQREIDEISGGEDLSRRIRMRVSSSEIARLSTSFNGMIGRLEHAFRAETQFASNASHELRTPTATILAECEYALEETHSAEEYRESLAVVQRQAQRMSSTISRLLSFTRLEQGTEKVSFERLDLAELLQVLAAEYRLRQPEVQFEVAAPQSVWVEADLALMTRLIENLVDNACKFGGKRVCLCASCKNDLAILSVEDDGVGIEAAEQTKIWNHFYQTEPSRAGNLKGSCGIGLALVRQIALLHGGAVGVKSLKGVGSTFTFRMPCAK